MYINTTLQMKPIIKWAGGKSSIIKILADYIYINHNTLYVEPFLGGGSVLFTFKPQKAIVNDVNPNLMCMYHTLKYFPSELVTSLKQVDKIDKTVYLEKRKRYNEIKFYDFTNYNIIDTSLLIEISTLFIFLNKTGFNGLYRENSKGEFNVPYGNYTNLEYDADNMLEISKYFIENDILLSCTSFENILNNLNVSKSSTIYLDPPYYECDESKFTSYSSMSNFNKSSHINLYKLIRDLSIKGKGNFHFICSNSYNSFTTTQPKLTSRMVEFSRNMDKKIAKEIISYTPSSTIWKELDKYLIGKAKFISNEKERDFIKLYSTSVLLNSSNRSDTFNIGKLGELHVKRIFAEHGIDFQKCPFKENVRPDGYIEIGNHKFIVEIKSRTYTCTGTASEKIDCIPRKLSILYKKYGYKSIVVFVAGQIVEKSGHAFLSNESEYISLFKEFAKREAGIEAWISIKDIPQFILRLASSH